MTAPFAASEAEAELRAAVQRRLDEGVNPPDLNEVCQPARWEILLAAMADPSTAPPPLPGREPSASLRRYRARQLALYTPERRASVLVGRTLGLVAEGAL